MSGDYDRVGVDSWIDRWVSKVDGVACDRSVSFGV